MKRKKIEVFIYKIFGLLKWDVIVLMLHVFLGICKRLMFFKGAELCL